VLDLSPVIAGLDPAIHEAETKFRLTKGSHSWQPIMDARVKPGHDGFLQGYVIQ
jgi:hypothetical protein